MNTNENIKRNWIVTLADGQTFNVIASTVGAAFNLADDEARDNVITSIVETAQQQLDQQQLDQQQIESIKRKINELSSTIGARYPRETIRIDRVPPEFKIVVIKLIRQAAFNNLLTSKRISEGAQSFTFPTMLAAEVYEALALAGVEWYMAC